MSRRSASRGDQHGKDDDTMRGRFELKRTEGKGQGGSPNLVKGQWKATVVIGVLVGDRQKETKHVAVTSHLLVVGNPTAVIMWAFLLRYVLRKTEWVLRLTFKRTWKRASRKTKT